MGPFLFFLTLVSKSLCASCGATATAWMVRHTGGEHGWRKRKAVEDERRGIRRAGGGRGDAAASRCRTEQSFWRGFSESVDVLGGPTRRKREGHGAGSMESKFLEWIDDTLAESRPVRPVLSLCGEPAGGPHMVEEARHGCLAGSPMFRNDAAHTASPSESRVGVANKRTQFELNTCCGGNEEPSARPQEQGPAPAQQRHTGNTLVTEIQQLQMKSPAFERSSNRASDGDYRTLRESPLPFKRHEQLQRAPRDRGARQSSQRSAYTLARLISVQMLVLVSFVSAVQIPTLFLMLEEPTNSAARQVLTNQPQVSLCLDNTAE